MPEILDFFALTHAPFIHARGRGGTRALMEMLRPEAGEAVLELGFGTGHTLVEVAAMAPGTVLYGVEKSPLMLRTAAARLRFCGLRGIHMQIYGDRLPFADQFFDAVYCESVLAILPDEVLPGMFHEIFRVLKAGGRFCCNESLWLPAVEMETIKQINRECRAAFGLVQAPAEFGFPEQWFELGTAAGFERMHSVSLRHLPGFQRPPFSRKRFLSEVFSRMGWLKAYLPGEIRRSKRAWRRAERGLRRYGPFLEGRLFEFRKPGYSGN
ncbi:MAG: class I SAM-dependent methyltransferase [Saprospirales bacterium]|nr:class I SAM-dependent methyltransferase [Saprospirales bacterium]